MQKATNGQITFAYLLNVGRERGEGGLSLLDGYVPILAPLLHTRQGQKFDPAELSVALRESYGANVHQYALEKLVPNLEARGWLVKDYFERLSNVAAYRITENVTVQQSMDPGHVEALLRKFKTFVAESFEAIGLETPDARLIEQEFILRLQQLPRADVKMLTRQGEKDPTASSSDRPILSIPKDTVQQADRLQEAKLAVRFNALFGLFLKGLKETDTEAFELLGRLASSALLAEVVLNYHAPEKPGDFKSITFYLDCPIVMDLLDLDSRERCVAAQELLAGLKASGATLRVFDHSIDEVRNNIKAALAAYRERNGHRTIGLRMRQSAEFVARAEAIAAEVPTFVKELGLSIKKAPAGDVTARVFSQEAESQVYSAIGPYDNAIAQERDSQSIAAVMRLRGGRTVSRSEFSSARVYFLTRNPRLASLSEDNLVSQGVHTKDDMPPCITDRTLAALLWLMRGSVDVPAVSQAFLLANCAAIPTSVDAVRDTLAKLADVEHHSELAKTFSVWSRSTRGIEVLTKATLGDPSLVTKDNFQEIMELVMSSAGDARAQEEREKVTAEMARKDEDLERLQAELASARQNIDQVSAKSETLEERVRRMEAENAERVALFEERLATAEAARATERARHAAEALQEEKEFLLATVADCDRWIASKYKMISGTFIIATVVIAIVAILIDKLSGWSNLAITLVLCGLALSGFIVQIAKPDAIFGRWLIPMKLRRLDMLLSIARRGRLKDRLSIDERTGKLEMRNAAANIAQPGANHLEEMVTQ